MPDRSDELVAACERFAASCDLPIDLAFVRELARCCGWGSRGVDQPLLPSGVSHGVPWGLSLALERQALEPRLFVEAQADPADVTALARATGADTTRLDAMLGLEVRLWHAVSLTPTPRWHAYLCVPDRAVAERVLRRAGIAELPALRPADRITMVSLDLTTALRVKAYVLAPDASLDELASYGATAAARHFGATLLGDPARRIWWLAAINYTPSASSCALHFGVPRHVDEPTAVARIRELLIHHELPVEPWEAARRALGAHHFVSFQHRGGPRITAYFLPEIAR